MVITINKQLSEFSYTMGAKPESTILIDAGIDLNSYNLDLDSSNIRKEYNIGSNNIVLFFMGWLYEFAGMKELTIKLGQNKEKYSNYKIFSCW